MQWFTPPTDSLTFTTSGSQLLPDANIYDI